MTPDVQKELFELLNALREDMITDEQFARLDDLIASSEQARLCYIHYAKLCMELRNYQTATELGGKKDLSTMPK